MTASAFVFRSQPTGPFKDLDAVRLGRSLETDDGLMPAGSEGTVVGVWRAGAAYEVEFSEPFHAVETVNVEDLGPASARG